MVKQICVNISQLIRFAKVCNHVTDFNARNKCLTAKLLQQGYRYHKLRKTFSKFYRRHYELISKYNVGLKTLTNNFQNLLPTVRVTPLNLFLASTVNLHGASNSNMFRNNLQIRLSPLKSPILRKYINPFKRPGMNPSISKCNAKKCNCCNHLCSKTTITSSVNGRIFSVVNDSDLD